MFGILLYLICFHVEKNILGVRIYSAFGADRVVSAISINPFLWPWLLGLIFCVIAVMIPMFQAVRQSPNEMLFPEKTEDTSGRVHAKRRAVPFRIVRKVVRLGASGSAGVHALIFVTGWVFVFGAAFMKEDADCDNEWYQDYLSAVDEDEGIVPVKADYTAHRNMRNAMSGNMTFNPVSMALQFP